MIWSEVAATGFVSLMGAGLVIPASRRFMLGDLQRDWLQDELELDCIDHNDAVTGRNKDGSLFRIWHIEGTSYDARVDTEQHTMLLGRSDLLKDLAKAGLSNRLFGVKRRHRIDSHATWPNDVLSEIGEAEANRFKSSYFIDWYLMLTGTDMQSLADAEDKIQSMMSAYRPVVLQTPETDDVSCPLTGFLNGLVSGDYRRDLPASSRNISGSLPASDLAFDKVSGTITTHVPQQRVQKVITVTYWPEVLTAHFASEIMALEGDIEISQVCEPWGRDQATMFFSRRLQSETGRWFGNPAAAKETSATLALLKENNTSLFATQFCIIPRAENAEALENLVREICAILGDRRIGYSIQTAGAPACWFNRLPKPIKGGLLPPGGRMMASLDLRDQNIASIWAFPHSPNGMAESPLGPEPIRWFATPSGQSYSFQFHVVNKPLSLANFLVFAPAGSGKSTLMMHLLGGLAKFPNVRSYLFDSQEGSRFMVEAMGGSYQGYNDLALNALDVGEDKPENRERIRFILKSLAGVALDSDDIKQLDHAVELAFQLDPPDRTLNALYPYSFARRSNLRDAFAQWVVDDKGNKGLRSHIFNAPHDSLSGLLNQSHMVGINMNEALKDPSLGAPIVAHISEAIFHSANEMAKEAREGRSGFVITLEEAARLRQNPGFRDLSSVMYREYRKLGGVVGMVFQDPAALTKSEGYEAIIENTATFIFFPNSKVTEESLKPFNLNEEQIQFIRGRTRSRKKNDRRVLIIKRDEVSGYEESVILDVDLTPLGKAARFYKSGPGANHELAELKEKWGDAWSKHL
ncbi:VirB4 family type IV secretion system protein [Thalassospira lucentensis]|uniref:VirB4 family type IV secretion system protein n=1 Tax=Thalassospira lucentensis TaxID=168935 RepID=UPI003D2E00FB|tara:strand:- start:372 stop:2786 length:2415 start_codon:yes stop_codon:yes gene_type:complete